MINKKTLKITESGIFQAVVLVSIAIGVGSIISYYINKMEITGPVIIISRFYKPNSLLSTWVLNLGLLPKVFKNGREYKPADLESIKKLSNI